VTGTEQHQWPRLLRLQLSKSLKVRDCRGGPVLRQLNKTETNMGIGVVGPERDRAVAGFCSFCKLPQPVGDRAMDGMGDRIIRITVREIAGEIESVPEIAEPDRFHQLPDGAIIAESACVENNAVGRTLHEFLGRRKFL